LAGAARTSLANPLTFIASGAAVGFWYFFPTEKGLGPRGYERAEIMIFCVFCLETKGTKNSRKNDASTAEGKTPGPPFFHPTAQEFCFAWD
jgi:hypothetical protein